MTPLFQELERTVSSWLPLRRLPPFDSRPIPAVQYLRSAGSELNPAARSIKVDNDEALSG